MKRILFIISIFISAISFSQQDYRGNKVIADKQLLQPRDTTFSKWGLASIGDSLYFGNGTYWRNISRPGGSSTGGANINVGAGYRLTFPFTNNVRTIVPGYGNKIDSAANANALTIISDSLLNSSRLYAIHVADSMAAIRVAAIAAITASQSVLKTTNNFTLLNDSSTLIEDRAYASLDGVRGWYNTLRYDFLNPQPLDQIRLGVDGKTLINLNQSQNDGVVDGLAVTYVSGLTYHISPGHFWLNGVYHTFAGGNVTLPTADASFTTIDLIGVDNSDLPAYIQGTPANPALEPQYDADLFLSRGFAQVDALATVPTGISSKVFYAENAGTPTEGAVAATGATINAAYTTNPHAGTYSLRTTAFTAAQNIRLTRSDTLQIGDYIYLTFWVKLNNPLTGTSNIGARLFLGNTAATSQVLYAGNYGLNRTNTAWQKISIPIGAYTYTNANFNQVRFFRSSTTGTIDFQIDDVKVESGFNPVAPPGQSIYRFGIEDGSSLQNRLHNLAQHNLSMYNGALGVNTVAPTVGIGIGVDGGASVGPVLNIHAPTGLSAVVEAINGASLKLAAHANVEIQPYSNTLSGGFSVQQLNGSYMKTIYSASGLSSPRLDIGVNNDGVHDYSYILPITTGAGTYFNLYADLFPVASTADSILVKKDGLVKSIPASAVSAGGDVTTAQLADSIDAIRTEGINIDESVTTTGALIRRTAGGNYETFTGLNFRMDMKVGTTTNAPVNGDVTLQNTQLTGKTFDVYKNGVLLDSLTGEYSFDDGTGTITFGSALSTDDIIKIRGSNTIYNYWPPLEGPGTSWTYLDFPTNANMTESPSHVWTGTAGSFTAHGISATTLTAGGRFAVQYNSADPNLLMGWNTSNTNGDYTGFEFGIYVPSGVISRIVNGTPTTTGVSISNGDWVCLHRTTGNVITLEKSSDKATWSVVYTFSSSSSTFYFQINPYNFETMYYPQYKLE